MQTHVKIGEGGRLIIPANIRKALDLHTGEEVIIRLEAGEMRIFRQITALEKIQTIASQYSKKKIHTDEFIAFRKQDSKE